jgi:hypothetical protein
MGTKVGEMRESLMDAIEMVKARKLDPQAALAISKLAAQVSLSLQVEANMRTDATLRKMPFGTLPIGDETPLLEGA